MQSKFCLSVLSSLFLFGCAVAPFSGPITAKPIGEGRVEAQANIAPLSGSLGYGVSDSLEVGGIIELQFEFVFAPFVKYTFFHNEESKFAFAGYGGVFYSGNSNGAFVGPVLSYQTLEGAELFFVAKYNYVRWNFDKFEDEFDGEDGSLDLSFEDQEFSYWQVNLGMSLNVTEAFLVFGSAGVLVTDSSTSGIIPMLGAAWRF